MREYGKVRPQFWIAGTGKKLRGDPEAQIVALYLMTCPHSNMLGVFHCPLMYIAHETGLPLEGASKGLRRLLEEGFCTYEEASETVFVHEMARYQIADELKPNDNRVLAIQREAENIASPSVRAAFFKRYGASFHIAPSKGLARGSEAPPKPRAGARAGAREKTLSGKPDVDPPENEVLAYLNERTGKAFRPVESNLELVRARMREGASVDDIRAVIDDRVAAWKGDEKMAEYLRPETLFRARKFAQYVGELASARAKVKSGPWWVDKGFGSREEAIAAGALEAA